VRIAITNQVRERGEATFAMKKAIGSAITVSIRVTAAATPMLRSATLRYTGCVKIVSKLLSDGSLITFPVNALIVHSDETKSTANEPRYATTSQAIGAERSVARRTPAWRCSHEESRLTGVDLPGRRAAARPPPGDWTGAVTDNS
jgi:hypothetical protein